MLRVYQEKRKQIITALSLRRLLSFSQAGYGTSERQRIQKSGGPCLNPLGTFWDVQVKDGPSYRGSTTETTKASLNSSGFQRGQQLHHLAALI